MALGDILIFDDGVQIPGAKTYKVNTGGPAGINAGELVLAKLGSTQPASGNFVTKWGSSVATKPSVGTDFVAGLAVTTSTETLTATGTVTVMPNLPGTTYLISPNTAATWNTQAKYDALVGARVLLNTDSSGVQTILATDHGNSPTGTNLVAGGNGLVVEPLNITNYPGKVRFSIKQALGYNVF